MKFDYRKFIEFSRRVKISTKEFGLRFLYPLLGTQEYLFQELIKGLEDDIHHFVIDKGRQQGITTGCLVLDLFWLFRNPGIHGNLITDDESNREQARANLLAYMDSFRTLASLTLLCLPVVFVFHRAKRSVSAPAH